MNKSTLYIILFFGLMAVMNLISSYNQHQEIVLQKNSLQFSAVDKQHIVLWPQKNDVFIIQDASKKETQVYRFASYYSGSSPAKVLLHRGAFDGEKTDQLFVAAINGNLNFQDTLKLSYEDRIQLLSKEKNFKALRLIQYNEASFWWKIIDSPYVILPVMISFLVFFFFVVDVVIGNINKRSKKDWTFLIKLFFTSLVIAFFFLATFDEKFSASWVSAFLRIVIAILPVFLLLQFIIKNYLAEKDFPDQELIKFATIFFGTAFFIVISARIALWVDNTFFDATPFTALATINFIQLMIFIVFMFACANLLNNILKHFVSLKGSEKELKFSQKKALASEAELNALQASVNPHFLYNALNSIASLAPVDAGKTEEMALALSSFYKYSTNREEEHLCALEDEIEMVNNYLSIEKIRFGDRLIYTIECEKNTLPYKVPRFLLQPIVENAIKYGYNKISNEIRIKIKSEIKGSDLCLSVFDEGVPFDEEMKIGYGLKSTTKKMKLLFPKKHKIEFINEPKKMVYLVINNIRK